MTLDIKEGSSSKIKGHILPNLHEYRNTFNVSPSLEILIACLDQVLGILL